MNEEKSSSSPSPQRREASASEPREKRASSKDIAGLLKGWDYEPGTMNVRKISGADGLPKLQMRLELGVLQMEMTGRPDGAKPHGCESLLQFYEGKLQEHEKRHGTDLGFNLSANQCQSLREEAQMYYQRYLSLLVLEDFPGVVRDTARNLRVLDFCGKFAVEEQDRLLLEQFRPYIVMMNSRARASLSLKDEQPAEALKIINEALDSIRDFFDGIGQAEAYGQSNEVRVLKRFAREIRKRLPVDPMQKLQTQLEKAIRNERYEEAAKFRDEIRKRTEAASKSSE